MLSKILSWQIAIAAFWGFGVTFAVSVVLVLTKAWHGRFSMDHTQGVQKFHVLPTPRIGGVAVVLGAVAAGLHAPLDLQPMILALLLAGLPAFAVGLAEDVTKRVGVRSRLIATCVSGLLAWWITDCSLSRVDVWGLDWLLQFTAISLAFTTFAVSGVANAINIIDGFNGLASTASTLAFVGYAAIAYQVGDHELVAVCLLLAACVWGFFWVNWPLGKIFLGDGGSYFIGFSLAWVAVWLLERHPSVSAFAALMVCAHPVIEVVLSMYRRWLKGRNAGHPDRLHFHSLVKQRYVKRWFPRLSVGMRNSITGLMVGGMTLTGCVIANLTYHSVALSAAGFLILMLGYVAIYARMVRHHWCSPITFLLVKPSMVLRRI